MNKNLARFVAGPLAAAGLTVGALAFAAAANADDPVQAAPSLFRRTPDRRSRTRTMSANLTVPRLMLRLNSLTVETYVGGDGLGGQRTCGTLQRITMLDD